MNVLIAPDKFKGTLTAAEVCSILEEVLTTDGIDIRSLPLADGGDGSLDVFLWHTRGKAVTIPCHDPLKRKINARYGTSHDGSLAFIEMAQCSGLNLLTPQEKNPLRTNTFGTGELLLHAINNGATEAILAIGGSATNDAGLGAAAALGVNFYDEKGKLVDPTGGNLLNIARIDQGNAVDLSSVTIRVLCDVTNSMHGEQGAAFVYAAQKGASQEDIIQLDAGLMHIAKLFRQQLGADVALNPGAGAAGGFGGGAMALLGATLVSGTSELFSLTNFPEALDWADVVITGEGKLDQQTLNGKLIAAVCSQSRELDKKVIAVCGHSTLTSVERANLGITKIFSLTSYTSVAEAIREPVSALRKAAHEIKNYLQNNPGATA